MVGRDAIENYEREVRQSFPFCPLCGSKQLKPNLVPLGKDSLSCESCKAQWHLIIGLGGFQWAILENASEKGEGKTLVGKRFDPEQWRKKGEKLIYTSHLNNNQAGSITKETNQIVREKEIIREKEVIVKIRCPYCKNLYAETLDKCPHCGARP